MEGGLPDLVIRRASEVLVYYVYANYPSLNMVTMLSRFLHVCNILDITSRPLLPGSS